MKMETNETIKVEARTELRLTKPLNSKEDAGVVRISDITERRQIRRHNAPKIDFDEQFLCLMQKPMLGKVPPLPKDPDQTEYFGVVCLRDTTAKCTKFHMFCSKENFTGESYIRVIDYYKHKPNIKIDFQVTTHSVSALSMLHSVSKHFRDHQWNSEGNVSSTDKSYTHMELVDIIHGIRDREYEKFVNYMLFLRNGKK